MTKKKTKAPAPAPAPAPRSIEDLKSAHKAYMLRTCDPDMTSHHGFVWPKEGTVEAPDWDPRACCGYGLHGLLWGAGQASLFNWDAGAPWLVVGIDEWVDLNGKVKAPRGEVVHVGDMRSCADLLVALGADPGKCVGGTATAGYRGTATAGDGGTATAGYRGTATAGDGGTATAGYRGTATAGYRGTATAGDGGTATAGVGGTATAGVGGTATAGDGGTATAGDGGTATAGVGGMATAGVGGVISIQYYDTKRERYCVRIGYIGEDGLEAGHLYQLDGDKFVPAKGGQE